MPQETTLADNPWRNIPSRTVLIFLGAVFFTFATLGITSDIAGLGSQSPLRLVVNVALYGLFAVCYAWLGITWRAKLGRAWFFKLFLPVFVGQFLLMAVVNQWLPDTPKTAAANAADTRLQHRLGFDALASGIAVIVGYAGFAYVFVSESRRHIRANAEKTALENEMQAAQQVQLMILPPSGDNFPGFHIDSVYKPAQQVGGDFFLLLPDGAGGLLFVIGDVAGKGLPAAMLVSMLIGSLRTAAETTSEPLRILGILEERLIASSCGSFATALAAHIAPNGSMKIANAGHLAPYLDGKEVELPGALPLGATTGAQYPQFTLTLIPGSRLTFYSDGIPEARNKAGELFSFERAQSISTQPAAAIAEAAVQFGQEDDITVVTIERAVS